MLNTIEITSAKTQPNGWLLNGNMLVPDAPGNSERDAILAWIAEGNTPEADTPTPEQLAQQAKAAVYDLLDKTAQQYDYRNFAEVVQFVNSNEWKAEADGLLAWQDAIWAKAYELLKAPIASVDAFVAQLPEYAPVSGS
jgi:negative regulator of genetic competence, sporulation and motility